MTRAKVPGNESDHAAMQNVAQLGQQHVTNACRRLGLGSVHTDDTRRQRNEQTLQQRPEISRSEPLTARRTIPVLAGTLVPRHSETSIPGRAGSLISCDEVTRQQDVFASQGGQQLRPTDRDKRGVLSLPSGERIISPPASAIYTAEPQQVERANCRLTDLAQGRRYE